MDQIRDQLSNVSLYDVKAYVRKAQNAVMNFTPIEAKVREATNNEPWGASSTAMQEIAEATHNYNEFHDIMSMIYRRFTDKTSEEWRQIYKALQLLDYLVKHGSERVIDYARSHVGVIQMLKNFHFVDANGKDQGVNVRNRAKELNDLLKDVARIRAERKKARTQKTKTKGFGGTGNKYGGFGNDAASSISLGGGGSVGGSRGRYSTSGSTSGFGGYGGGRVFGDGGGFDGSEYDGPGYGNSADAGGSGEFNDNDNDEYEEYDAGGDEGGYDSAPPPVPSKAKKSDDPFGFSDNAGATQSAPALVGGDDDDEFDDFQSATPANETAPAPAAAPKPGLTNLDDLFKNIPANSGSSNGNLMGGSIGNTGSFASTTTTTTASSGPNYAAFSSFQSSSGSGMASPSLGGNNSGFNSGSGLGGSQGNSMGNSMASLGGSTAKNGASGSAAKPAASSSDAFSNLWSTASTGVNKAKKSEPTSSLSSMAKKSNEQALWGAPAASSSSSSTPAPSSTSKPAETGNLLDL